MSIIEEILKANEEYARDCASGELPVLPRLKLAVVGCMDARLTVEEVLGLKTGDAHIIRNAGGIVTDDALRSLLISHHLLGTQEFMVINHTDCGMLKFEDEELRKRLEESTGETAFAPAHFHAFSDLERNVRQQLRKIRSHPWIPDRVTARGFVYDVKTGKLGEVGL